MEPIRVTKKHHKHLNNPFPSTPKSLPFIQGTLFFNPQTCPSNEIFCLGKDFQLIWRSDNGGSFSIHHSSEPSSRAIWSTVPGQSFVSAALADTEVEESRGAFVVKDRDVHLICDHQTVEEIRVINEYESSLATEGHEIWDLKDAQFPVLQVKGWVFSVKKTEKTLGNVYRNFRSDPSCISARYWFLFDQKTSNQIGFQVNLKKPNFFPPRASKKQRGFGWKLGWLRKKRTVWYRFSSRGRRSFKVSSSSEESEGLRVVPKTAAFNRVCITYSSEGSEKFFGFGEQFSHMDLKGRRVPIFVQEQGIGRGDQPITLAVNLVSYRAGGDWSTTYAPSPFYITSKMRSLYLEGYDYSVFDLTRPDRVQIQIYAGSAQGRILHGTSPSELITNFTETIGRPPELPEWIISGAVVGMQGGTDTVLQVWDVLKTYDVPISAFWLQDWVGQRETVIGSQLWWNWEVDTTRYWGWQQLLKDLRDQQIRVMTYCNPCLAPTDEKPNKKRNLFQEAKKLDILVKDKKGEPYMVSNTAFKVGMLDLTHPNTTRWFKQILQDMVDVGVNGWMADFGEGLPADASIYSGEDPISAHNRYPELWAQINREFVEEWKESHQSKTSEGAEDGLAFFMRAGFRESPKWGMLFWEGDQMVSWQVNDGIKSAVVGLLSSGLSGYAFNHSDIGGYCTVNVPIFRCQRSEELLLRWIELSAFTIVFRTHEGNKPSCNKQFYTNHQTLSQFARFAKVYRAWKFYRIQLVKEAAQKGLPVCRHLFVHYPSDKRVQRISYQQFLVGTEILVVPVLDKGQKNVKAYFPQGERCSWQHVWTGKQFTRQGSEALVEAPIGYPAIFVKVGSFVGETFIRNLKDINVL